MQKNMIYIGLDDTDNLESRGTGHLARCIAAELGKDYDILGVTRHQLLVDPRVPYTKKNSCAAILLTAEKDCDCLVLFNQVKKIMMDDFQQGSDPGLCVTSLVVDEMTRFGRKAQTEVVSKEEAYGLAEAHGLLLEGLGGTNDGVIGAVAAVGLTACGDDGRYVQVGGLRELAGKQSVEAVLSGGAFAVCDLDGAPVNHGLVQADKLRPARRGGKPIVFVDWQDDCWLPQKLD